MDILWEELTAGLPDRRQFVQILVRLTAATVLGVTTTPVAAVLVLVPAVDEDVVETSDCREPRLPIEPMDAMLPACVR